MRQFCISFIAILSCLFIEGQDQPLYSRLFSPQQLKDDIDSLYRIVTTNHPELWKYADKQTTDRKWESVKESIHSPMTRWGFIRYIAPLLNQYHDGHTNISYDFDYPEVEALISRNGTWFPYQVVVINNELIIGGEYGQEPGVLSGQRIVSINGKATNEILDTLLPLMAGDYRENIDANAGRLFPFFLWAAFGWEKDYRIRIKHSSGRIQEFTKPGIPPQVYFNAAFPKNDWSMQVFEQEGLAVVECRNYRNEKAARTFIDSAFSVIRERKIRKLAFDIRRNGGGSSAIGDYFLSYLTDSSYMDVVSKTICDGELLSRFKAGSWMNKMLVSFRAEGRKDGNLYTKRFTSKAPEEVRNPDNKFKGEFFLLTGPATYSSAHMTAMAVKCYGLGKIVGQPTGERLDLTGESIGFKLPNTGLYGYCATAVYKAACGNNSQFGVQPDVFINLDQQPTQSGTDPVIAFLKKTETGTVKSLSK